MSTSISSSDLGRRRTLRRLGLVGCLLGMMLGGSGCGRLARRVDHAIETGGSELTGVPVVVDRVWFGLFRGAGEVRGVRVSNPDGFQDAYAFEIRRLRLNLGLVSSLAGEPVVLDELTIGAPVLSFEYHPDLGANLTVIADHVRAHAKDADRAVAETAAQDPSDEEPRRIRIQRLKIHGVSFIARLPGRDPFEGVLPELNLRDVGGEQGVTPGELGSLILVSLARQMFQELTAPRIEALLVGLDLDDPLPLIRDQFWAELQAWDVLPPSSVDRLQPLIEDEFTVYLDTLRRAQERGFLDVAALERELAAAAEDSRDRLAGTFEPEEVDAILVSMEAALQFLVDDVRRGLADLLCRQLGVGPDQLAVVTPIVADAIRLRMELIHRVATDPSLSPASFGQGFVSLQSDLRTHLEPILTPGQLARLAERQAALRRLLEEVFFGFHALWTELPPSLRAP